MPGKGALTLGGTQVGRCAGPPAQSIFGVAVKLWIATHDNLPHKEPEYTDEKALVAARDDALRLTGIGGVPTPSSSAHGPDWLALLKEYRERMKAETAAVRANVADTEEQERATEEATAETQSVEHRIADAEADGLLGLAVKLAVLWNNSIADTGNPHEGDALMVGSALDYLAKQTGIDPYVTYGRDCNPIRASETGRAS